MPNPKTGTVTKDVGKTGAAFKAGRVEYRNDRYGNVHVPVGRVSFEEADLLDNVIEISEVIQRARPSSSKGKYIKGIGISSTMGPGVKIDLGALEDVIKERNS